MIRRSGLPTRRNSYRRLRQGVAGEAVVVRIKPVRVSRRQVELCLFLGLEVRAVVSVQGARGFGAGPLGPGGLLAGSLLAGSLLTGGLWDGGLVGANHGDNVGG